MSRIKICDKIDGALVEATILKSRGKASACNMCGFRDFDVGDTKYVVEHWIRRDEERQGVPIDERSSDDEADDINWDAPER